MVRAYVGVGANLGDAHGQVLRALEALAAVAQSRLVAQSIVYRTVPWQADGPDYANAVAALDTQLTPDALLRALQAIEVRHGRERPYPNAPRTLDLDLLLHGDCAMTTDTLTLPHPRMHARAFVLRPLLDVAPDVSIPGQGRAADLLAALPDQGVRPWGDAP